MATFIIFLLVLSLVVLVHEFGHFFVARLTGMKVFEFGWGFPPRLFGFYRDPVTKKFVRARANAGLDLTSAGGGAERQEEFPGTVYSVNWLPLGGFVKIKGENGENKEPDSFGAKNFWAKMGTLLAGVGMNFLLAALLLGAGFIAGLPADLSGLDDARAIVVKQPQVMIQHVEKDSAAAEAGLEIGDIILSLNGNSIKTSNALISTVRESQSSPLSLEVRRDQNFFTKIITPKKSNEDGIPRLGIGLADAGIIRYPWYIAVYKGFVAAALGFLNIFVSLYILFRELIGGNGLAFGISGPVGIAITVGESARLGFSYLINVTAMISLSLAALNVLPIPALDGGRALFVLIEKIFRRRVPVMVEQVAHTVGFVAILLLIVAVTWRDITLLF